MKYLIALALLTGTFCAANAQSRCDIRDGYSRFVKSEIYRSDNRRPELFREVVGDRSESCYSNFINRNTGLLNYLLNHFATASVDPKRLGVRLADSNAVQKAGAVLLRKDSLFNSLMLELAAKSIDHSRPKDTVRMEELLDIAVKFFAVIRIGDDNSYAVKVCGGRNDIRSTEPLRKPFIEAFCFSSILKHYSGDTYPLYDDFVGQVQQLYKFNLGTDKGERLLRAQGALYVFMSTSKVLREMLLAEYGEKREDLPFVLVP